jgi:hypothetical protein
MTKIRRRRSLFRGNAQIDCEAIEMGWYDDLSGKTGSDGPNSIGG